MHIPRVFDIILILGICQASACTNNKQKEAKEAAEPGTFGYDVEFLSKYQETIVLSNGEAMMAVCPAYQGRVMTSSSSGE